VVLVHGTGSSPARWAEMINELEGDSRIREKYQIWVFLYDSGNLIPYSAGRLRGALMNALHEFDPDCWRRLKIDHLEGFVPIEF